MTANSIILDFPLKTGKLLTINNPDSHVSPTAEILAFYTYHSTAYMIIKIKRFGHYKKIKCYVGEIPEGSLWIYDKC